jgi:hypothetical protein
MRKQVLKHKFEVYVPRERVIDADICSVPFKVYHEIASEIQSALSGVASSVFNYNIDNKAVKTTVFYCFVESFDNIDVDVIVNFILTKLNCNSVLTVMDEVAIEWSLN